MLPSGCFHFLLGEDGVILEDGDFVFYNSDNRAEPFDRREKFGNKKNWREETVPVSKDGSVVGPQLMTLVTMRTLTILMKQEKAMKKYRRPCQRLAAKLRK